jgi:hypothetical protein
MGPPLSANRADTWVRPNIHHMKPITESIIEQSAIETLQAQGWAYVNGKGEESTHFPTFVKPTIIR